MGHPALSVCAGVLIGRAFGFTALRRRVVRLLNDLPSRPRDSPAGPSREGGGLSPDEITRQRGRANFVDCVCARRRPRTGVGSCERVSLVSGMPGDLSGGAVAVQAILENGAAALIDPFARGVFLVSSCCGHGHSGGCTRRRLLRWPEGSRWAIKSGALDVLGTWPRVSRAAVTMHGARPKDSACVKPYTLRGALGLEESNCRRPRESRKDARRNCGAGCPRSW